MTSEEECQKLNKEGSVENDNDNEETTLPETVLYIPGGKEDFVSLINASNETNGWIRKYRDYDCYRKMLGPKKLHDVAARTKIGDYIGSCICLEFDSYAFVSLYYVRPEYRKRGVGTELFKRVVNDKLRKNIGLHAAKAMAQIYDEKLGFNKRTSWMVDAIRVKNADKRKIIDGKEVNLQHIVDYDAKVAKCRREDFVRQWAVERIDAVLVNSEGEIVGYGCGRLLSIVGFPGFGPMYCDSDDGFKLLFHALLSCFDEELKERNVISLRVPTTKSSTIQQILHGVANLETDGRHRTCIMNVPCVAEIIGFAWQGDTSQRGEYPLIACGIKKDDFRGPCANCHDAVMMVHLRWEMKAEAVLCPVIQMHDQKLMGSHHLVQLLMRKKSGSSSLPRIIHHRELYGKARRLNRMACRVRLDQLNCPYLVELSGVKRFLNIARECLFIGLSNDSRYAVGLIYSFPDSYHSAGQDEDETELNVIIFELSATLLRPAFIATFAFWPSTAKVYATFPYSSSHISIVGLAKQNNEPTNAATSRLDLEPFSVIAKVKFILFRFRITVSLTTCLVMSYRWNGLKMSRTVLRSTDHGGIINGGTALISYLFTKNCPPLKARRMSRMIMQVVDPGIEGGGEPEIFQGCNSQDIRVDDATSYYGNIPREYYLKRVIIEDASPSPAGLIEPLFITETVMDIERLLYEIMPVVVSRMYGNYKYEGIIDYEVDLLDCEQYIANIVVTAVVEAKGPGEAGRNSAYIVVLYIVWNTFEGTRQISSFRGMRLVPWTVAHRPDQWYPFKNVAKGEFTHDERVISNLPFLNGESLEFLASASSGITIWKEFTRPKIT
uniref:N-acetyltransferase domain-containing protein n=1 Tax=Setaria digitata TaxID=48799 RepID=A0A915PQ16_9BILA